MLRVDIYCHPLILFHPLYICWGTKRSLPNSLLIDVVQLSDKRHNQAIRLRVYSKRYNTLYHTTSGRP